MRTLFLLTAVFFCSVSWSQKTSITEELNRDYSEMTEYPAVILESNIESVFQTLNPSRSYWDRIVNWATATTYKVRFKVLNDEGVNLQHVQIPYFSDKGWMSESVSRIKAGSYNLENGKVVKSELKKRKIKKVKKSKKDYLITFSIPNVKKGSIVEYEYTFTKPVNSDTLEFVFPKTLPVIQSNNVVLIPAFVATPFTILGEDKVTKVLSDTSIVMSENIWSNFSSQDQLNYPSRMSVFPRKFKKLTLRSENLPPISEIDTKKDLTGVILNVSNYKYRDNKSVGPWSVGK